MHIFLAGEQDSRDIGIVAEASEKRNEFTSVNNNISYINVKVYASLIRHIVACSFRLKDYCFGAWIKERVRTDSCVACSFRLMDYCFGTWIKERVKFICSVLVSAQLYYCFGILIKERSS